MKSQSIEMEGFPVFIKALIQPLNPHETQSNGRVSSLTGLFLSTAFIVSKTCAFNLIQVFLSSQWSVGGGKRHNTPFHNDLCPWGWDLFSGCIWIVAWLPFFPNPVFVL